MSHGCKIIILKYIHISMNKHGKNDLKLRIN